MVAHLPQSLSPESLPLTRVLITGADGFIGSNLLVRLSETPGVVVSRFTRSEPLEVLRRLVAEADFVLHFAGVNRPPSEDDFTTVNRDLTATLCEFAAVATSPPGIAFASSMHAVRDNAYGRSKRDAEDVLLEYSARTGAPVWLYRFPHVIGKWSRPNYNSVVATFCYNVAHGLPLEIHDPDFPLRIVYIDDLVEEMLRLIHERPTPGGYREVIPNYAITVGDLAERLRVFHASRKTLMPGEVGDGLDRALYATYLSHLPPEQFSYVLGAHDDPRGRFVEMLRTPSAGQLSFFTARPGVTRGGHYHHTKNEKFLVVHGHARFRFQHVATRANHELFTSGQRPEIVDTVPGWSHDITNVGDDDLIVMLWANERFDPEKPDTYPRPL